MDGIDIPPGSFPLRPKPEPEKKQTRRGSRSAKREKDSFHAGGVFRPFQTGLDAELAGSAATDAERDSFADFSDEDIHAVLDEIHCLGDRVKRDYRLSTVQEYKQAVRKFMRRYVQLGLDLAEHTSGANILNRKKYALIEVVDAKLERLALGLVQTQREQFEILGRIDEINGLLVDLIQ